MYHIQTTNLVYHNFINHYYINLEFIPDVSKGMGISQGNYVYIINPKHTRVKLRYNGYNGIFHIFRVMPFMDMKIIQEHYPLNTLISISASPVLDIIDKMYEADQEGVLDDYMKFQSGDEMTQLAIRYAIEHNLTYITKHLSADVRKIAEVALSGNHRL